MKILVYLFGGIGNWCVWVPKFKGLFNLHSKDEIHFIIRTGYSFEFCTSLLNKSPDFKNYYDQHKELIRVINYEAPFVAKGFDVTYDFINHRSHHRHGTRMQSLIIRKSTPWCPPVSEMYPQLGYDPFPVKIDEKLDHIVICPIGSTVKNGMRDKWEKLGAYYSNKEHKVKFIGEYSKVFLPAEDLFNLINTARLWIGIDTGTRNIALLCKTPVVEVGGFQNEGPHDIFHPVAYRSNSLYFKDFRAVNLEEITTEIFKKWGI